MQSTEKVSRRFQMINEGVFRFSLKYGFPALDTPYDPTIRLKGPISHVRRTLVHDKA